MKRYLLRILSLSILLSSCGGGYDPATEENEEKAGDEDSAEEVVTPISIEANSDRTELNSVDFNYVKAYKKSEQTPDKIRKAYMLVFSDQEIALDELIMSINPPKDGQTYLMVEFLGEYKDGIHSDPDELKTGNYKVASLFDEGQVVDAFCYRGTSDEYAPNVILAAKNNPQGVCQLTKVGTDGLEGSLNLSFDGFTVKGNFKTPLHADFWAKAQERRKEAEEKIKNLPNIE